ncbi:MAG: methionine--tRNA ligase [Candidatus Hadarchaeales archaeon]
MAKFYVTTPIYYINAEPHIGHAYTTVIADVIARWRRLRGEDVFFLTGLDENSVKTVEAARARGFTNVQAYANMMAKKWQGVWRILNISNDDFIRTTQERHVKNVQEMFLRLKEAGDIYKGVYEGFYCEGCEAYISEEEMIDGKCPLHKTRPKKVREENYFFRLSKYREDLLKFIEETRDFIQPESRRNEVLSFLRGGLKDLSVSRAGLKWGIDVPGDPSQKIWVWFDALINYLLPRKYWPADLHIIAKDILRFHCIIWPAMLMSAGYPLPRRIFAHGFLTVDGQKISKSLGNVIDPVYLVEKYSADAVRYFLVREISFGQDGNFSEANLVRRLNEELANVLGNFVHRVMTFIKNRFGGVVPQGRKDAELEKTIVEKVRKIDGLLEELKVNQALEEVMQIASIGNEYFQSMKPWEASGENLERAADCVYNCVNLVKVLSVLLSPFLPATSEAISGQLGISVKKWEDAAAFDVPAGHRIGEPKPIFRKVEGGGENPSRVSLGDFQRLDLRVGRIVSAEKIPETEKLLKLEVDLGEERRTLVAGIGEQYKAEELLGKSIVVVVNLEPAKIRGVVSDGMLLAAEKDGKISLLTVDRETAPGAKVR